MDNEETNEEALNLIDEQIVIAEHNLQNARDVRTALIKAEFTNKNS